MEGRAAESSVDWLIHFIAIGQYKQLLPFSVSSYHDIHTHTHTQTRRSAEALAGRMSREGHNVALITGDSTMDQRIAVLNRWVWSLVSDPSEELVT